MAGATIHDAALDGDWPLPTSSTVKLPAPCAYGRCARTAPCEPGRCANVTAESPRILLLDPEPEPSEMSRRLREYADGALTAPDEFLAQVADELDRLRALQAAPQAEPVRWALEWGAISLPVGDPSRVTAVRLYMTREEAEAARQACGFDAHVFPVFAPAAPQGESK